MENSQKKPLYLLEEGVDESGVELLPRLKKALLEITEEKVEGRGKSKNPYLEIKKNKCWVWLRGKIRGYGTIKFKRVNQRSHRLFYEMIIGSVPKGLILDHLCRNRSCCNPLHLEPVTNKVNVLRGEGLTAKNYKKEKCLNGHDFDEKNTYLTYRGRRACRKCHRIYQLKWKKGRL